LYERKNKNVDNKQTEVVCPKREEEDASRLKIVEAIKKLERDGDFPARHGTPAITTNEKH
jgi:hypothetical protein